MGKPHYPRKCGVGLDVIDDDDVGTEIHLPSECGVGSAMNAATYPYGRGFG